MIPKKPEKEKHIVRLLDDHVPEEFITAANLQVDKHNKVIDGYEAFLPKVEEIEKTIKRVWTEYGKTDFKTFYETIPFVGKLAKELAERLGVGE